MTIAQASTFPVFCPYCASKNLQPLGSIMSEGWNYKCGVNASTGQAATGCGRMFRVKCIDSTLNLQPGDVVAGRGRK